MVLTGGHRARGVAYRYDVALAEEMFVAEIARSRRYGRPCAVAVLRPVPSADGRRPLANVRPARRANADAIDAAGAIVDRVVRRFDLVTRDRRGGRVLVLAPETGRSAAQAWADRLRAELTAERVPARVGIALFAEDGHDLHELVSVAEMRAARDPGCAYLRTVR